MRVHTLACEAHLWFAIPCLRSLAECSAEPVRLVIHDDGSLTEESLARFVAAFPDAQLVSRRAADEQLAEALGRFPHMAAARKHLPHVLKLFDATMINPERIAHPEPVVCYVDTDVLFQKRFQGLFPDEAGAAGAGVFMMDRANSFGAHPGDFWPFGPLRVARQLNSGLFWVKRDRIDYERMEYLFKRWGPVRIKKYHGWFEQTVWADHAWRTRCGLFDPDQFGTASTDETGNKTLVGVHYVTPARNMLKSRLEAGQSMVAQGAAEEIRVQPAKPFGMMGAAWIAAQAVIGQNAAG
jgi:hypothetical protein